MEEGCKYVTIREAASITGMCHQVLRKMADAETIRSFRTPSQQRRFNKLDLEKMCYNVPADVKIPYTEKTNFIYTRVSSKKQLDDLHRQIDFIRPRYPTYRIIKDIGSGVNFKRQGLQTILDHCIKGDIGEVVVAHRDRLSRFGFDLIDIIVSKSGGKIVVIDDERNKTTEQELAEDLLSIVHIYSCRQMGRRKYSSKEQGGDNDDGGGRECESDGEQ
jgi:putative resolvase